MKNFAILTLLISALLHPSSAWSGPNVIVTEGDCNGEGQPARWYEFDVCVKGCDETPDFIKCARPPVINFVNKKHRLKCNVSYLRTKEIYDNCIIDKLAPNANSTLRRSVRKACERISCNPSVFEKMKY